MKNNCQKGKVGEYIIFSKLINLGYDVLSPITEHQNYDIVIHKNNKFAKLQIKSAFKKHRGKTATINGISYYAERYFFKFTKGNGQKYRNLDFILAYIEPEDITYILPLKNCDIQTLQIGKKGGKYEKFKNNWGLLDAYFV